MTLPPRGLTTGAGKHRVRKPSQTRNLGWAFLDRGWRLLLGFVVTLLIARFYGPVNFGALSFALALVTLVQPAAGLGIDQIVVRNIIDDQASSASILGTAAAMRFFGAVVAAAIVIPVAMLIGPAHSDATVITALLIAPTVFQTLDPIEFNFQAHRRADIAARARVIGSLAATVTRVVLVVKHASIVWIAATYLIDAAVPALILLAAFGWTSVRMLSADRTWARKMLRDGSPLILSAIFVMIYQRIDQVMIGAISGVKEAGIYAASTRLSELFNIFPTAALAVLTPILLRARTRTEDFERKRDVLFGVFGMTAVIIAVVNIGLARISVRYLFGPEFNRAAVMLMIQGASTIFVFLGVVQSICNIALNKISLGVRTLAVGTIVNVGLNLFLIPRYGGKGAAAATLIAYALSSTFAYVLFPGVRDVPRIQLGATVRALLHPIRTARSFLTLLRFA